MGPDEIRMRLLRAEAEMLACSAALKGMVPAEPRRDDSVWMAWTSCGGAISASQRTRGWLRMAMREIAGEADDE